MQRERQHGSGSSAGAAARRVRLQGVSFHAAAEGWHDFYLIAGTAAATLVGLLFVGLSLHLRAVLSRPEVRSLARATLTNFGLLMLISLFLVIPEGASDLGLQLLIAGAVSIVIITPSLVAAVRSRTRTLRLRQLTLRFGLSTFGYTGVIVAGALLMAASYRAALDWLVTITLILLIVSLRNSWDLLVSVGEATVGAHSADD
jgi:hypothetical protein